MPEETKPMLKISVVNFKAKQQEVEYDFPPEGDMFFFADKHKNLRIRDVHVTSKGVLIYAESKRAALKGSR